MKDKEILSKQVTTACVNNTYILTAVHQHQSILTLKSNTHPFKMRHIRHIRHICHQMYFIHPFTCVFYCKENKGSKTK
jgi:hypothetical protein